MGLIRTTEPATPAVTLHEVKQHLRVDGADEDVLLKSLILAATEQVQNVTGRQLVEAQYRLTLDHWPADGVIHLPRAPLISVEAVKYLNSAGTLTTIAGSAYQVDLDSLQGRVVPALGYSWPAATCELPAAVRVEFTAGYGEASQVPEPLKLAIKEKVRIVFDELTDREIEMVQRGVDDILWQYRILEAA